MFLIRVLQTDFTLLLKYLKLHFSVLEPLTYFVWDHYQKPLCVGLAAQQPQHFSSVSV